MGQREVPYRLFHPIVPCIEGGQLHLATLTGVDHLVRGGYRVQ